MKHDDRFLRLFLVTLLGAGVLTLSAGASALDWNYPVYPSDLDPPLPYQRLAITTTDSVRIAAWYIPPPDTASGEGARHPAVLVFPREGETLPDRLPAIAAFARSGFAVLAFEDRGRGASGPFTPQKNTLIEPEYIIDAASALDILWTRPEVDTVRIGLYGESMGAMLAFALVRDRAEPRALVAVSIPYNLESWTQSMEELDPGKRFAKPEGWRRKDEPDKVVRRYNGALQFIVGEDDRETPPWMSEKLYDAYPRPRDLWIVPGASHRPPSSPLEVAGADYWERITVFLGRELATEPHRGWPGR